MDADPDRAAAADLRHQLGDALAGADLVVVENVCSLPLNPPAAEALATVLAGRPAILHHHDLPWQRERFADVGGAAATFRFPPTDPAWAHVTINDLSRTQLGERGIEAVTIRNAFDVDAPPGDRARARRVFGVADGERLVVHPTRAIPRKDVPAAIALAAALGAAYWLVGPAEEGYGPILERLLAEAPVRTVHGLPAGLTVADAYAAADAVVYPSRWEGFGNPTVESALHRRPLAIGDYPVARELAAYGFRWFPADDAGPLAAWLAAPDQSLLDHNADVARRHFSLASLDQALRELCAARGWTVGGRV